MAKVVVVEDEPELRHLLVGELQDAGHEIAEAGDGFEGLASIEAQKPDVIISDIGMPRMDGYELWKCVQGCPHLSEIPFLFLSAFPPQDADAEGIRIGAEDYFTKPVDFDDLLSRIDICTT